MADAAACGGGGREGDAVRGEARGLGGKRTYIPAMGASWPSDELGFWNGGRRMDGEVGRVRAELIMVLVRMGSSYFVSAFPFLGCFSFLLFFQSDEDYIAQFPFYFRFKNKF